MHGNMNVQKMICFVYVEGRKFSLKKPPNVLLLLELIIAVLL